MRKLRKDEKLLLKRRQEEFENFYSEMMPVLTDFLERLNLNNPALVLRNAEAYLESIDSFLKNQIIEEERLWILLRIGYYIGEFFVQKYSGCWFLNEIPDSRYFGRYVVGKFACLKNMSIMIDPFHIADEYLNEAKGRSLKKAISEVSKEIEHFDS